MHKNAFLLSIFHFGIKPSFTVLYLVPRATGQSSSRRGNKTCSKSPASWGFLQECDVRARTFSPVSQGFASVYFYVFSYHYLLPYPRLPTAACLLSPATPHKGLWLGWGGGHLLPRGAVPSAEAIAGGELSLGSAQGPTQTRQVLSSAQKSAWRDNPATEFGF